MKKTKELLRMVTIEKMKEYVEGDLGHFLDSEVQADYSNSEDLAFPSIASFICDMINNIVEEEICSGHTSWDGCSEFHSIISIRKDKEPVLFLSFQVSSESYDEAIEIIFDEIQRYTSEDAVFDTAITREKDVLSLGTILKRKLTLKEVRKIQEFMESQEFMKEVLELALKR